MGHGPELVCFDAMNAHLSSSPHASVSKGAKLILQYASTGSLMNVFESVEQAAQITSLPSQLITESLRTRRLVQNQLWVKL